jgi:hypothetical protein
MSVARVGGAVDRRRGRTIATRSAGVWGVLLFLALGASPAAAETVVELDARLTRLIRTGQTVEWARFGRWSADQAAGIALSAVPETEDDAWGECGFHLAVDPKLGDILLLMTSTPDYNAAYGPLITDAGVRLFPFAKGPIKARVLWPSEPMAKKVGALTKAGMVFLAVPLEDFRAPFRIGMFFSGWVRQLQGERVVVGARYLRLPSGRGLDDLKDDALVRALIEIE